MENRNQYNSPRDRIDDALLIRLLNEDEGQSEYTCTGERRNGGTSRSRRNPCDRRNDYRDFRNNDGCCCDRHDNTGCGNNREQRNHSKCGNDRDRCDHDGCSDSCSRNFLSGYHLAMVYTPDHEWEDLYEEEEALSRGTMFRALEFPFYPGKCGGSCGCR